MVNMAASSKLRNASETRSAASLLSLRRARYSCRNSSSPGGLSMASRAWRSFCRIRLRRSSVAASVYVTTSIGNCQVFLKEEPQHQPADGIGLPRTRTCINEVEAFKGASEKIKGIWPAWLAGFWAHSNRVTQFAGSWCTLYARRERRCKPKTEIGHAGPQKKRPFK